ncbi:MAG: hypothetical protein MI757_18200 [Pirellulales bacterium]|nr:hypothetical protein [Pirellulales bacterium]
MRSAALSMALVASYCITGVADELDAVDFFAARKAGDLDAKFIAANEKRGHLVLKNNGKKPLKIRMPAAFAGVPILAQFQPIPLPGPIDNTPQGVGFPGPGINNVVPNGVFNVAPERFVELKAGKKRTIRVVSVCLDHGQPTPNARMKYDVVPLADYKPGEKLAALMQLLGGRKYSQPAVQAVAWHYANGKTLAELRTFRSRQTGGLFFTRPQIDEAVRLHAEIERHFKARRRSSPSASDVSSR